MRVELQRLELSNLVAINDDKLLLDDMELAVVVARVLGFLQLEKPASGPHPAMRKMFQLIYRQLGDYLWLPADQSVLDDSKGIIWCAPNMMGQLEFRVLEFDDEMTEVTSSRIFACEPETAAVWLKSMVGAASGKLPFDSLIEIRDQLNDRIKSRINGDAVAEQASSFVTNTFAVLAERNRAPALKAQLAALSDDDYDRLNRFCAQHKQLNLEPQRLVKIGIEFENLRTAASNIVVKLAGELFASLNTQQFAAVQARAYSGDIQVPLPTRRTVANLSNRSTRLFSAALDTIATQLKARLMAETMLNIKLAQVDHDHSGGQIVELERIRSDRNLFPIHRSART